jgi:hypothetical protein
VVGVGVGVVVEILQGQRHQVAVARPPKECLPVKTVKTEPPTAEEVAQEVADLGAATRGAAGAGCFTGSAAGAGSGSGAGFGAGWGWGLKAALAFSRMVCMGVFVKNFAAGYRSGVLKEKVSDDPLPPCLHRNLLCDS